MIVSRLILKNGRNFQSVNVVLQDRMFLVGPNASGKSNLLDAFRFLRDIAKDGGGLQKAVADRGRLPKIRCLSARRSSNVEIEIMEGGLSIADAVRPLAERLPRAKSADLVGGIACDISRRRLPHKSGTQLPVACAV